MYHIVYLITNIVNQKYYVGKHSTYNLDDGYLGSGCGIKRAIKKYGKENFKRDILHFCVSEEHAYEIESLIVNKSFINNPNTYNNVLGGIYFKEGRKYCNESKYKLSQTRKRLGIAKGQLNPASSTNMSKEKLIAKNTKTANTRRQNGSYIVSDETKSKLSMATKGIPKGNFTQEHIHNMRLCKCKSYTLVSPDNTIFIITDGLKHFCKSNNLSLTIIYNNIGKGKIDVYKNCISNKPKPETTLNCQGWEVNPTIHGNEPDF